MPTYRTIAQQTSMINHAVENVNEDKKFFTERQIQKAKLVRQIYHALGTPSVNDFKAIIRTNMVKTYQSQMKIAILQETYLAQMWMH